LLRKFLADFLKLKRCITSTVWANKKSFKIGILTNDDQ
jgi:hypothetical protein